MNSEALPNSMGRLHWIHWLVVFSSIGVTFGAWWFSKTAIEEKVFGQFEREANQVIELVAERMQKYEDGLWGGVAAIQAKGGDINRPDWHNFASSLRIEEKYPGINGIGVIHYVQSEDFQTYLSEQRKFKPDYRVHPSHANEEFWPITYVEPSEPNNKAIGLDMAHETNRWTAAKKARDSGAAQVTGPIVLVQDSGKTPGFLFYAPFYRGGNYSSLEEKRKNFVGMVYAPFVFEKLMEGTLRQKGRHVGLKISDEGNVLYDEFDKKFEGYDESPIFKSVVEKNFYGRIWKFDIRSTEFFREASANSQPTVILIGGIIIDTLLLLLFVALARSNSKAINYANKMNAEADFQRERAAHSSKLASLGEMAGGIAHEINNPLTIIQGYAMQIQRRVKSLQGPVEPVYDDANKIMNAIDRISGIVDGLRKFSRDDKDDELVIENIGNIINDTLGLCGERFKNNGIDLKVSEIPNDLCVMCRPIQISQVMINLLNNAFQASNSSETKSVSLNVVHVGDQVLISVANKGERIPDEISEKIFEPFFTTKEIGAGTGLGLSLSLGIMRSHKGDLYLDRNAMDTTFVIRLPVAEEYKKTFQRQHDAKKTSDYSRSGRRKGNL